MWYERTGERTASSLTFLDKLTNILRKLQWMKPMCLQHSAEISTIYVLQWKLYMKVHIGYPTYWPSERKKLRIFLSTLTTANKALVWKKHPLPEIITIFSCKLCKMYVFLLMKMPQKIFGSKIVSGSHYLQSKKHIMFLGSTMFHLEFESSLTKRY